MLGSFGEIIVLRCLIAKGYSILLSIWLASFRQLKLKMCLCLYLIDATGDAFDVADSSAESAS